MSTTTGFDLDQIVHALHDARRDWRTLQQRTDELGGRELPSVDALRTIIHGLRGALFPMRLGPAELRQENGTSMLATPWAVYCTPCSHKSASNYVIKNATLSTTPLTKRRLKTKPITLLSNLPKVCQKFVACWTRMFWQL